MLIFINNSGVERSNNPFTDAFHDFEYQEPDDEEFKASTELANKYMQEQEEEERQWFIKQEQDLLKQLINDFQVEDFIAGTASISFLEGELDEETIKAIYAGEGEDNSQPEARLESKSSESLVQGGEGAGRSSEATGRNGGSSGAGEERLLAEEEEHEWTSLVGVVVSLDDESLWIDVDQEEDLEITGRAWSFILDGGMVFSIEDEVALEGFYEDEEFEVSSILNLTTNDFLQVREDSGRPLWSGGAGR